LSNLILGLDIGTSAVKAALLDDSLRPVGFFETRTGGNPAAATRKVLARVLAGRKGRGLRLGVTGTGRGAVADTAGIFSANEVVALAIGAARFHPRARSVIEIGGQTSRWVLLDPVKAGAEPGILDFALNDVCAAGSGAFLEQQASRLRLGIEEFASLAASARRGAPIAGRCSVFAKTDMIHLQQKGTPLDEIAYGLCQALARNFLSTVLKGREAVPPVLLAGGGARNDGLVNAFREILGLEDGGPELAEPPHMLGALGAAVGASTAAAAIRCEDAAGLVETGDQGRDHGGSGPAPLGPLEVRSAEEPSPEPEEFVAGFLGVDIGSVSTNLVLVDAAGRVRAGVYLPTRGRPIEVLSEGYRRLKDRCPGGFAVLGVGTTGSGRHLAGAILRADVVHNEITAQLRSAVHYVPEVDTVFEIGGQDSKFISARGGRIVDFAMNKVCAAGTGSFLEEQASILGIRIEDEFSGLASASSGPADLGSRCTVFMETELADALGRGAGVADISAGLAFSIARNYLEKVVAGRPVGDTIVFQGGVASNPSVVRAFGLELGRPVAVHPHNRISGAIGAALLAREKVAAAGKTSPEAAEIGRRLERPCAVTSFTCPHCSNSCRVNRIAVEDEVIFFGDTCERYTAGQARRGAGRASDAPDDLFKEREAVLESFIRNPQNPTARIGIPRASILHEFLPFWAAFFNALGAEVIVSPASNQEILELGLRKLPAETCLPIKIAFGHIEWFADKSADWVFFPSIIDLHQSRSDPVHLCPYTESLPFMARATTGSRILAPQARLNGSPEDFLKSMATVGEALGVGAAGLREAFKSAEAAQAGFRAALQRRGREALETAVGEGREVWAVLGRPYVLHDPFLNLNLGRHLARLDVLGVPIDFLPIDGKDEVRWPGTPPWRYNRQVIEASLWAADEDRVRPVVLTNFGCGLDAFNMRHVDRIFSAKPHLVLEFDEHRAEAGLITRLEAYLDEVTASRPRVAGRKRPKGRTAPEERKTDYKSYRSRKLVLPQFADHAFAFSGAMKAAGMEAEVLPLPDAEAIALGEKHSTGKECHAFSVIAGDFLKFARSKRHGGEVFYFPGAKYNCVLNQYDKALNYLAEDLGIADLEAFAPPVEFLSESLGMRGLKLFWQGLVSIDLLVQAACSIRPYEIHKGTTEAAHALNLKDVETGLAAGDAGPALARAAGRLGSIIVRREPRPVVGVAGDIYTRINPVANHGLFLKLEELGCEVRPPSFFIDEVDFDLGRGIRKKIVGRQYGLSSVMALLYLRKELEKARVRRRLGKVVPPGRVRTYNDVVRFATPYVGLDSNQFLVLNVAKMVELAERGVDGVINAICFNCMLGTASAAIAGRIRKDYNQIPIPTFVYTGTEPAAEKTRLEAFVYQVHQFAGRKGTRPEAGSEATPPNP